MTVTTRFSLQVEGMTCQGCANAIKTALGRIEGVLDVRADWQTGKVQVSAAAGLTQNTVEQAIQDAGFDVADDH